MDYSQLISELQQASLFDLYRLQAAINKMLDAPEWIQAIKRRLRPGMTVTYFDENENRLVEAVVEEIHRTRAHVQNIRDGKRWTIRFCTINLDGVDTDIHSDRVRGQVDRNQLKVGDLVGFHDRQNREQYGAVVRLNQKTVTLTTNQGAKWRVAYSLLFKVMNGEGGQVEDPGLIKGEIVVPGNVPEPAQFPLFDPDVAHGRGMVREAGATGGGNTDPASPPKIGRNSPCPCGSGRKHKRCCLRK